MELKKRIATLPPKPGVYRFLDSSDKVIYVGKAKNLRKRVSSYFSKKHDNGKTALLVRRIADLAYIVVDNEYEALLLENALIKKYRPRYNIQLRDDKSYPFIRITNERFPRVYGMRNPVRDGSDYYGPYASVRMMQAMLDMIGQLYKLRTCNYKLSEENIKSGKYKRCLEFHIDNCLAPCEGLQDEVDYMQGINEIRHILKGDLSTVMENIKSEINRCATVLQFERAAALKERLEILTHFRAKSTVANPSLPDMEVYSIVYDPPLAWVNFIRVRNGSVVQGHTVETKCKLEESKHDILLAVMADMRRRFGSPCRHICVPFPVEIDIPGATFHLPQRGDKKALLDLSLSNAMHMKKDRLRQMEKANPARRTERLLGKLADDLKLKEMPRHIECFDNSHFQGDEKVSACVVFHDAKPSKKEYRHFIIKEQSGADDFADMHEVITRRYKRLLAEKKTLPQLVVVDGGKGQLSSAVSALGKLGLRGRIAVIGIAKKLEEIYYPDDPVPLHIDKRSESLKIIQQMRDEAHRFGITHHRKRRMKKNLGTALTEIEGIGPASAGLLLRKLKSIKRIREADEALLASVVGKKKAGLIIQHFKEKSA